MKSVIRFNRNKKGIECLNCKQPLSDKDNFCSNCGQVNDLLPLSIKQYLREFFSGFFAFDTRTLNTILPLLFKPGKVTLDYINGKRIQYVNPFQLYLHTSIIFFLVIGILISIDKYNDLIQTETTKEKQAKIEQSNNIIELDFGGISSDTINNSDNKKPILTSVELRKLISQKVDSIILDSKFKEIVNSDFKDKDKKMMDVYYTYINELISSTKNKYQLENDTLVNLNTIKNEFIKISAKKFKEQNINYKFGDFAKLDAQNQLLSVMINDSAFKKIQVFSNCKTNNVIKALDSLKLPRTRTNIFLFLKTKQFKKLISKNGDDTREEFLSNLLSKTSVVLFFIIPVFTLFLSLIYIRRKFNYTEHLIFSFHNQTVFFILLLVAILLNRLFKTHIFLIILLIYFAGYLFLAMKRFYKQSKFKTVIKYFLTVIVYLISVVVGSILLSSVFAFIS